MKLRKIIITEENRDFPLYKGMGANEFYTELHDGEYVLVDDSGVGICGSGKVSNNMILWYCKDSEIHNSKIVPPLSTDFSFSQEHRDLEQTLHACSLSLKVVYSSSANRLCLQVLGTTASQALLTIKKSKFSLDVVGEEQNYVKSLMVEKDFTIGNLEELAEKLFLFNFKDVIFYYEPGKGLCLPGETNA